MVYTYNYGHKVIYNEEQARWFYEDGVPVDKEEFRPCPKCGKMPTPEGYDACLGYLPGVKHACCGHGVEDGYIIFENGKEISFKGLEVEE